MNRKLIRVVNGFNKSAVDVPDRHIQKLPDISAPSYDIQYQSDRYHIDGFYTLGLLIIIEIICLSKKEATWLYQKILLMFSLLYFIMVLFQNPGVFYMFLHQFF